MQDKEIRALRHSDKRLRLEPKPMKNMVFGEKAPTVLSDAFPQLAELRNQLADNETEELFSHATVAALTGFTLPEYVTLFISKRRDEYSSFLLEFFRRNTP